MLNTRAQTTTLPEAMCSCFALERATTAVIGPPVLMSHGMVHAFRMTKNTHSNVLIQSVDHIYSFIQKKRFVKKTLVKSYFKI